MKLLRLSTNYETGNQTEATLSGAQSQVLLRTLTSFLVETWEWIRRPETSLVVGRYTSQLPVDGQLALTELKKHFGKSALLHNLRNRFTSHFPKSTDVLTAFEAVPQDEDWSWYVADDHTNSFYLSCEMVVGSGLFALTRANSQDEQFKIVLNEVIHVTNLFWEFLVALLTTVLKAIVPPRPLHEIAFDVHDAVNGKAFAIPFYVEGI